MIKITNDISTLNGDLVELGETVADNLVSMGVTGADASDGLTTLAGKILDIAPSVGGITPSVSIDISKTPSTVYVHDSILLSAKVNADYDDSSQVDVDLKGVLQGATVTFKNGNTTIGTAVTGADGIATYTLSNMGVGNYSITAHFDGSNTDYESATSSALTFTVNHNYSLAFSQSSYTASGGSCTVECTLLDNGVAVSGETVTFSDGTSQYSGITNSNGVASYTFTSVTAGFTCTATYNSATATCTVVTHLFYDDCTSDQTSQYDTLLQVASTSTNATLSYDSTEQAYTFLGSGGDKFVGRVLPNTRGKDNIKIRCKVKFKNTNAYNQFFIIMSDSLNPSQNGDWDMWRVWGSGTCNYVQKDSTKYDSSVNNSYTYQNYCYIELVKSGTTVTANLYDSSLNLLKTTTQTCLSYSNPYFAIGLNGRYNSSEYGKFIKEILVDPL